ncbi:hypothetical protein GGG16DRAFT_127717 [Schizophyllum commune]
MPTPAFSGKGEKAIGGASLQLNLGFVLSILLRSLLSSKDLTQCPSRNSRPCRTPCCVAPRMLSSRTFTTSPRALDPEEKPRKPKAATPLRRAAAQSLPIRSNPTPTRSSIQPVNTLTTAERFVLSRLRARPPTSEQLIALYDSWWVPRWTNGAREGELFIFANGSIVGWGLEEADLKTFAAQVTKRVPGLEVNPLAEPETEELEFVTDSAEDTRLQGDLILLGKPTTFSNEHPLLDTLPSPVYPRETLLARYAFSQALARSTSLSALEVSLDEYLSSLAALPLALERTGKPNMDRKTLIKKLGTLMKFRQGISLNRENYSDVPDFYWEEPELERHFKSLSDALEIKARTDSVNEKITYAGEMQSTLRQLLTESSAHDMEVIIILLIAVEVVIAFIRDGPELWEMLTGSGEKEAEHKTA